MKNTIFFDSNFNFTLLENEENPENSIYIKFHTSNAANQVLNILANASTITESLASNTDIVYELEQTNWTNNGATAIWLSNDEISSPKVKIIFSEIPTASCAINRGTNTVFIMQYEGQAEEESGGSGSGGSGNAGSAFDFVETIRNIGFRLLDEPSAVSVEYDEINNRVEIKWTDPADIATNEPAPAEWAGTVVVRKSGSAPLHKWDGTIITDSTTRDEYSVNALIDNNVNNDATYYYGIFPYDTNNFYRYTKVESLQLGSIPAPYIAGLSLENRTNVIVDYSINAHYTWDYITLVYKKGSAPTTKTDGTAVSLLASDTSVTISGLENESTYYFKIFAQVQGASEELESNMESIATDEFLTIRLDEYLATLDYSAANRFGVDNMGDMYTFKEYNSQFSPYYGTSKILVVVDVNQYMYWDTVEQCLKNTIYNSPYEASYVAIPLPRRIPHPQRITYTGKRDNNNNTYCMIGAGQVKDGVMEQTKKGNSPEAPGTSWTNVVLRKDAGQTSEGSRTFLRLEDMAYIDYLVIELASGYNYMKDIEIAYLEE